MALINAFFIENAKQQTAAEQAAASFLVTQSQQVKESLQKSENSLQVYRDALLLKDRIEDQQRVVDALRQRYRDKHPQLIQARALLADLMQAFDHEFQKVARRQLQRGGLLGGQSGCRCRPRRRPIAPPSSSSWSRRGRTCCSSRWTPRAPFTTACSSRAAEPTSAAAPPPPTSACARPPTSPSSPSKPKRSLILAIGFVFGVARSAAAAVFGANALDSSIKTMIEAEELLGVPLLGAIPLFTPDEKSVGPPRARSLAQGGHDRLAPANWSSPTRPAAARRKASAPCAPPSPCSARRTTIAPSSSPARCPTRARPSSAATTPWPWPRPASRRC